MTTQFRKPKKFNNFSEVEDYVQTTLKQRVMGLSQKNINKYALDLERYQSQGLLTFEERVRLLAEDDDANESDEIQEEIKTSEI